MSRKNPWWRLGVSLFILAFGAAVAAGKEQPMDPYTDNLLVDGQMRFAEPSEKDATRKVYIKTPRYWRLRIDKKELQGYDLPFDKDVKFVGDCSVRMDGTGGRMVFSRYGWGNTSSTMRHGWAYRAGVRIKLKDVKGKVWVQASYSWDKVKSKEFSGTADWTEVPVEFVLARGTNLLKEISVCFEGTGTVWVDDLQLRMKNPEAFKWWEGWNGAPLTARLSEIAGVDEKAGVLKAPPKEGLDQYGGIKAVKGSRGATGFFYVEKIGGKWWLVTPEGNGFFKTAMFVPSFPSYQNYNEVIDKIGGRGAWALQTYKRLESWGFNSIEWGPGYAMSVARGRFGRAPAEIAGKSMAYTANLRFELATIPSRNGGVKVPVVDWGWRRFPDVFTDEFAQAVEQYAAPKQKGSHFHPRPDDPWLIGYLLADEPPWYGPEVWYGSLTDGFHKLPDEAPGKKRWMSFLRDKYGKIEKLNKAWDAGFASWEDFSAARALPRGETAVEDRRAFMGLVADRWYELVAAQVRKYDTNHLVLGGNATRLYPEVYAAEAKSVDVLCASLYGMAGIYRPHADLHYYINEQVNTWTGKPIMIGYMSGARDGGGLPGIRCVETAKQRGQSYLSFMRKAAGNDAVVGVFWWMYQSWPEPNGEGYTKNWGIVTPDNRAYMDTLPYVQRANCNVYRYRLGKAPEQIEPPTLWAPSHRWLLLDKTVKFRITPLPYPVDKYEIELSRADWAGRAEIIQAAAGADYVTATRKLAPGLWQWRARAATGEKNSDWSLPFVFEVAAADEVAAFNSVNHAVSDGRNWKHTVVQQPGQNAKVNFRTNVKSADAKVPIILEVEKGKNVRRIDLSCTLPEPLALKKGIQYSLRVGMRADTEAAASPMVTMTLKYGYRVTEDYAPIDKGWLVQRALAQNRITRVRTTLRSPIDRLVESLSIQLNGCRGKVELVTVELLPETEYEVGTTLMDDYKAIVAEFQSRRAK